MKKIPALVVSWALLAGGGSFSRPAEEAPSTSKGSLLTAKGREQIAESGEMTLDLSHGKLSKADFGLGPDEVVSDVKIGRPLQVTIIGSKGTTKQLLDRVRFGSIRGQERVHAVYTFAPYSTSATMFAGVRDSVDQFGFSSATVERWISSVESRPTQESEFSIGRSTKFGYFADYDLSYNGQGHTHVIQATFGFDRTP